MRKEKNKICFDNDEEFFNFAVKPQIVVRQGKHGLYTDWEFTDEYEDAVSRGVRFVVSDPNSRIMKNQIVCYKTISKNVENVDYFL